MLAVSTIAPQRQLQAIGQRKHRLDRLDDVLGVGALAVVAVLVVQRLAAVVLAQVVATGPAHAAVAAAGVRGAGDALDRPCQPSSAAPGPTSTTVPDHSWPGSERVALRPAAGEAALIDVQVGAADGDRVHLRTAPPSGPGAGTGTSSRISCWCGPVRTTARMRVGRSARAAPQQTSTSEVMSWRPVGEDARARACAARPHALVGCLAGVAPSTPGVARSTNAATRQTQPSPPSQRQGNAPMVTRVPATSASSPPRFSSMHTLLRAVR